MLLKQYYLGCLSHASYLIGDEGSGSAVVIDPQRDIDQYLADAEAAGMEIRHVMLTHFHADFVAGHVELHQRTGAEVYLGARADAEYAFTPMRDGEQLQLGRVRLRFLETPGHTPEAVSILVFDLEQNAEQPHAVLTGDTLFIGDVGRPDLMASVGVTAEELAAQLYDSLHRKLLPLPDATLVYPAHGAGSMCGRNLSTDTVSTIGEQREFNYALQPMSREDFIRLVTGNQPVAPAYFSYDAQLNRRQRQTLDDSLEQSMQALSLAEALEHQGQGAILLDTRDPYDYAAGHLQGSINVGLGGRYASWAGTVIDRQQPIVLLTDPGREREAAMRLGRIGFDQVLGFLDLGNEALKTAASDLAQTPRFTAEELDQRLRASDPPLVLDVRAPGEWSAGHLEGAQWLPLGELNERMNEVPKDRELVLQCAGGYRSMIAASLLERAGWTRLSDLAGGMKAWEEARLQTVS